MIKINLFMITSIPFFYFLGNRSKEIAFSLPQLRGTESLEDLVQENAEAETEEDCGPPFHRTQTHRSNSFSKCTRTNCKVLHLIILKIEILYWVPRTGLYFLINMPDISNTQLTEMFVVILNRI